MRRGVCEAMPGEVKSSEMVRPRGRQVPFYSWGFVQAPRCRLRDPRNQGSSRIWEGSISGSKNRQCRRGGLLDSAGGERRTNWI